MVITKRKLKKLLKSKKIKNYRSILNEIDENTKINLIELDEKDRNFLDKLKVLTMEKHSINERYIHISKALAINSSTDEANGLSILQEAEIENAFVKNNKPLLCKVAKIIKKEKIICCSPGYIDPGYQDMFFSTDNENLILSREINETFHFKKQDTKILKIDNDFICLIERELYLEGCECHKNKEYDCIIVV